MGTLIADASKAESSIANPAGIGSVQNGACGIITINGGIINATGQVRGSGIGGSYRGAGGTITINGGVVIANTSGDATGIGGGTFSASGNITITGGDVTATGGTRSAGIGGSQYGRDGNITITGGKVTATGGSSGIGVGYNGSGCTFSTGDNGNAFIVASSISDKSDKNNWSGIIFEGNNGQVYGNQTLSEDVEVPSGKTLTIPESVTLTIPEVVTLTDNGTITGSGAIDGSGQIMGNGTIENSITVDSSITIADTVKYQRLSSVTISFNTTDSTAEYGSTITITATAAKTTTRANSARATVNTVEFFVNGTSLGTAQVSGNTATLNSVILSEGNGWKIGSNTVTAEFGGSDYLREATGTGNFTVTAVKLQKPGNLQWDSTTPGKATWSEVINASGYSIQLYKDGSAQGNAVSVTGTEHTFDNITTAGSYTFKVKATNSADIYTDSDETESDKLFTVSFDTDGAGTVNMQLVADGGKVTEPDALTKTGFTFMGWYSDSSLEESCEWDFSNAVSEPTTLYAKWLSSNAGVTAVSVDGKAGEIKGTDISVELPHNTTPPTEGSKITIQTAGGASVSALTTNDNGETWTFTVTAEDGNTKETYTIHVSVSKTHTFGDWQPGADNHYKECVCGERMEEAHNAPDDGDCLTAVKCTVCNYETKAAEASHSFTSYTSDGNATCTADGTETAKCNHSGCNQADTRTETGSKLEHSYRSVVTPPTCTEKGYTTHTCTRCGYSYQDSHTDVDGHTFGGWTQISSPTCTDNGAKKRTCQSLFKIF